MSGRPFVSLGAIQEIIEIGMNSSDMLQAVNNLTSAVQRNEHGKNDLIEQVLEKKLGTDFLGDSQSDIQAQTYSQSKPDI